VGVTYGQPVPASTLIIGSRMLDSVLDNDTDCAMSLAPVMDLVDIVKARTETSYSFSRLHLRSLFNGIHSLLRCGLIPAYISLVTRWEAPGGFGASSGLWLANLSFSTLMLLVGSFDLQNCLPDNLYCVGGDVKPCSVQSSPAYL